MLFKFVFRVALVAGAAYAAKKVLDRTGATEKLVDFGSRAVDVIHATALTAVGQVVDVLDDALHLFAPDEAEETEPQEAMTTPQAAQWANANVSEANVGGAGARF